MKPKIVIIASGTAYQEAAGWAAATYMSKAGPGAEVSILLPEEEPLVNKLSEAVRTSGCAIERFQFKRVSERKFTSQLKCQAYVHAVSGLRKDGLLIFADADTCCFSPITIPGELVDLVLKGRIGLAADIEDRHFQSP